jgi:hypothetical protein
MKSRIREEEDHSIRGERWNGGAGHVVTASTRVIYGKLHILGVFNELVRAFARCTGCGHALSPEH